MRSYKEVNPKQVGSFISGQNTQTQFKYKQIPHPHEIKHKISSTHWSNQTRGCPVNIRAGAAEEADRNGFL